MRSVDPMQCASRGCGFFHSLLGVCLVVAVRCCLRPSSLCLVPQSHETRDDQALSDSEGVEGFERTPELQSKKPMLVGDELQTSIR